VQDEARLVGGRWSRKPSPRIRASGDLLAVAETVTIRVRIERVRGVDIDFLTVIEPVIIGIGVEWIGPVNVFLVAIGKAVSIGVEWGSPGIGSD
jgi:hypothetical protein